MRRSNLSLLVLGGLLALVSSCGSGPANSGGSTDGPGAGDGGDAGGAGEEEEVDESDPGVEAPPPSTPGAEAVGRLLSAVPGADFVHLTVALPEPGVEAALFRAATAGAVYDGAPALEDLREPSLTVTGLPADTELFFGLGVRRAGESAYVPTGAVLRARTGAPVFVDPGAAPGGDGSSLDKAFDDLLVGVLSGAGGNVWLRGGSFDVTSLPLVPGTAIYGGFPADFDPARRGSDTPTVLRGQSSLPVLVAAAGSQSGTMGALVDGVTIDGRDVASVGVDADQVELELHGVAVRRCNGRGIRLRNEGADEPVDVTLVLTSATNNGGDGLSANGPFDLVVDGCTFADNVQEGLDVDDLVAPEGEDVSLVVRGSAFRGNGTQGLDVDLSEPAVLGPAGGRFSVTVEGSAFEDNAEEGLLIDFDFELTDGWEADVLVRGCRARSNGAEGVRVDADAPGDVTVHRLSATANALDGLAITSETAAGLAVVTSSAFSGNLGAGIRASLGNWPVAAVNCVLAGNLGGGVVSELVPSTATSCVAWLQPEPFVGTARIASAEVKQPDRTTFVRAPEAYARVSSVAAGSVSVDGGAGLPTDGPHELADDGVVRSLTSGGAAALVLDPEPAPTATPTTIVVFPPGDSVDEDWTLVDGSPAAGLGLAAPGGAAVDAGVHGAPCGGLPGAADAVRSPLFRVARTEPPVALGLASISELRVGFRGGELSPASVDSTSVRALGAGGTELPVALAVAGGELRITPPGGDWGASPVRLELTGLRATDGTPLCAPTALVLE